MKLEQIKEIAADRDSGVQHFLINPIQEFMVNYLILR